MTASEKWVCPHGGHQLYGQWPAPAALYRELCWRQYRIETLEAQLEKSMTHICRGDRTPERT
jgi:hypothetical protein